MASFTDQIMQFRPYVQQLPLEAMAQVGMYKQQKYEEGVQKIQSYIDNVAGLDVLHDSDKQYLQSKLNDLGSRLKSVAAGDFSNFQLVNSVGGMANQIVRDSNVQNAVQSTTWYRKQKEKIQKDIDEGKSNPANIRKFDKAAMAWLNTKKVGQKFGAQYNPYFDVDKFAKETFDAVKPDGYTFEQIYETDTFGNIKIDPKTKRPIFSPVMTRLEQEGRFPKTVRATLNQIFSDPRVAQQLQITGEYNYERYEGDSLKALTKEMTDKKLAVYDTALAELNIKKATGQDVQAEIDDIMTKKKNAEDSYAELFKLVDSNPDALRGMLYKDDVMENYTTMFGTIKEKRTSHEGPGWNQMFKQQQEVNEQKRHAASLQYQYDALRQADNHHRENIRYKMLELAGKAKPKGDGREPVITDMPADISLISMEEEMFNSAAEKFNGATNELILQSGALSNQINKQIELYGGKITPAQALDKIVEFNSKKLNMSPQQYTQWLYDKGIQEMAKVGDANLTPAQKAARQSAQNAQSNFRNVANTRAVIDKKVGVNPMLEITKSLRTERISLPDGTKLELTPQDQYDVAMAYAGSDWYESAEVKAEAKAAQERLKKKGFSEDVVKKAISWMQYETSDAPLKIGRMGDVTANTLKQLVQQVDKRDNVIKAKDRAAAIKEFYQVNPILEKSLVTGDSETDKARAADVLSFIGMYNRAGLQESPGFKDNVATMSAIASGKEKGTFSLVAQKDEVSGQITPKVVFTREDGSFGGEMTINNQQASVLGSDVNQWWQPPAVRQAQIALEATGNGTTSLSGNVNDAQTYIEGDVFYTKPQFKNLRSIADDVKGNISIQPYITDGGEVSMLYYGHVFVNGANGGIYKPRTLPPVSSIAEVLEQFNGLTPQMIEQFKIEAKNKK